MWVSGRRQPTAVVWLSIALAVAVIALIVVGIALLTKDDETSAESAKPAAAPSTSEDWIAAVCERGTYQNGKGGNVLSGSTGAAMCYSAGGTVFVATYESQFRFDNAVAGSQKTRCMRL